jgi:hypothetical protein
MMMRVLAHQAGEAMNRTIFPQMPSYVQPLSYLVPAPEVDKK